MTFKNYIMEMEAIDDIKLSMADISLTSDQVNEIDDKFEERLSDSFGSPEEGFAIIQDILSEYDVTVPEMEEMDPDGSEIIIKIGEDAFLYFIYGKDEMDKYEFYAELTDQKGVTEILTDEEEENDE